MRCIIIVAYHKVDQTTYRSISGVYTVYTVGELFEYRRRLFWTRVPFIRVYTARANGTAFYRRKIRSLLYTRSYLLSHRRIKHFNRSPETRKKLRASGPRPRRPAPRVVAVILSFHRPAGCRGGGRRPAGYIKIRV